MNDFLFLLFSLFGLCASIWPDEQSWWSVCKGLQWPNGRRFLPQV